MRPDANTRMEIYILRHGSAEHSRPGGADSARALTDEGREEVRRVLRRAAAAGAAPSLILTSPFVRAVQSAAIAAAELPYRGEIEPIRALEPDGSPYNVWEEIRARKQERAILLAGHQPLAGALVAFLLGCPALDMEMRPAALVRVDTDRFGPEPHGVLKWVWNGGA